MKQYLLIFLILIPLCFFEATCSPKTKLVKKESKNKIFLEREERINKDKIKKSPPKEPVKAEEKKTMITEKEKQPSITEIVNLKEIFKTAEKEEKERLGKIEKESTPLKIEETAIISPQETKKNVLQEQKISEIVKKVEEEKIPLTQEEKIRSKFDKRSSELAKKIEAKRSEMESNNLEEINNSINFSTNAKGNKFGPSWPGMGEEIGKGDHPLALEVSSLPKDKFGLIDWALTVRQGKINPLGGLTKESVEKEEVEKKGMIILTGTTFNDVLFPHDMHTYWLNCPTCHEKIFVKKSWANPISMMKNKAGQYCGRCHGKVAFPLEDCNRCHVLPKVNYPY